MKGKAANKDVLRCLALGPENYFPETFEQTSRRRDEMRWFATKHWDWGQEGSQGGGRGKAQHNNPGKDLHKYISEKIGQKMSTYKGANCYNWIED